MWPTSESASAGLEPGRSLAGRMRPDLPADLITELSHELRTPLTSIVGYAEILIGDDATGGPAAERMLRAVRRNATRLTRVLDSLSALADLERGDIPRGREPVDIVALLAQLPAAVADETDQHRVAVRTTSPGALPPVTGSADDLLHALVELAVLAVDASEPGETVAVTAAAVDDEVVVTITAAHSLEPAADARRSIGHAVAYGIIAAHAGQVGVIGSRLTVHVPTAE
jgi:signal transduction histidine kinase